MNIKSIILAVGAAILLIAAVISTIVAVQSVPLPQWKKLLPVLVGLLVFSIIFGWASYITAEIPNSLLPSATAATQPGATATSPENLNATVTSLITPTQLEASGTSIAYDFEGSGTGWDSDTQRYNPKLAISTDQALTGHHSLKVTTQFIGDATLAYQQLHDQDAKNLYTQTNAKVYFTQEPPAGFSGSGPFNFDGKQISCAVFLPQWLLSGGEGKMQVQLFVKNRFPGGFEPNAYSRPQIITSLKPSNVQKWVRLTFTVGNEPGGQVDQKFDPTQVQAIGVLLTVLDGSTINQRGSFYIDDCILPH